MKWLRVNNQSYHLRQGESTIGRSPYCSIQILSDQASREHAAISLTGDTVTLSDLGSRNGTYINGVRITEPTLLLSGALICIGGISLSYFEGELSQEPLSLGRTQETPALSRDLLEARFPTYKTHGTSDASSDNRIDASAPGYKRRISDEVTFLRASM